MGEFRKVPWQRNLRKIPDRILSYIEGSDSTLFRVSAVRQLSLEEMSGEYFQHIEFPTTSEEQFKFLPDEDMGKFSRRNVEGWEVVRKDLPMITKTYYWETPNFGDAATYGTHMHSQDREVYQREYHEARYYEIQIDLLKRSDIKKDEFLFSVAVDVDIDRNNPNFNDEILFTLNLLQENWGAIGIVSSSLSKEEYVKTINLDWTIFPPGSVDELVKKTSTGRRQLSEKHKAVMRDRLTMFSKRNPVAYLKGDGGFSSYIGALYADDLVVFENMEYGNALYILYEDWKDVSKRSRIDLLKGTDENFDRLTHTSGWEEAFDLIIQQELRARKGRRT